MTKQSQVLYQIHDLRFIHRSPWA